MMHKGNTYWLSFAAGLASWCVLLCMGMSSCKKSFSSNQFEDDKLVVLAEIIAIDSVKIPIGKTIKAGNGALIRFEKVNDATVTLTEQNNQTWILQPNYSPQYYSNPTTLFTNRKRFKSNTSYSIEIKHPTLGVVKASTHIPAIPKLISIDTAFTTFQHKEVLKATITWQDMADKEDVYVIEALKELVRQERYFYYMGVRYSYETPAGNALYHQVKNHPNVRLLKDTIPLNKFIRLDVFTQDNNSENAKIDNLSNPFRRIFLPDKAFNGQAYTTQVYIDRQFFIGATAPQKGRVRIQLKSASREMYNYLLQYEKYKTDFGTVPANQLISPAGNIQNGLGIFGGSARRERILYFDKLW
jgi:hypothetical protein